MARKTLSLNFDGLEDFLNDSIKKTVEEMFENELSLYLEKVQQEFYKKKNELVALMMARISTHASQTDISTIFQIKFK